MFGKKKKPLKWWCRYSLSDGTRYERLFSTEKEAYAWKDEINSKIEKKELMYAAGGTTINSAHVSQVWISNYP